MAAAAALLIPVLFLSCASKDKPDPAAGAPPKPQVVDEPDLNVVRIDRPERFSLAIAGQHEELPEIRATGVVNPDIEKTVPVISLASGRVVALYVRLGDDVHKGQLLLKVLSNDISNAFQTYLQAKADEELARKQLERAQLLYAHGSDSLNDLQVAEDAEQKAKVAEQVAAQELRTMGADPDHPDPIVNIYAPASGTIVEQNIVGTSIVHTPDNQPNLFTIANLSTVWVICNVYENDLPNIRLGDSAEVQLNAYPDRQFRGRISNIGKVLDSNIRTAPVRIVLNNPGIMREGMFVTATLFGPHGRIYASVPSTAILHLHDRNWVFIPSGQGQFRRTEVTVSKFFDGKQDIASGIGPGQRVVNDALALSAESEQ
jgi:cobalt-zinc-cadmium efflux system membrane fusion protein